MSLTESVEEILQKESNDKTNEGESNYKTKPISIVDLLQVIASSHWAQPTRNNQQYVVLNSSHR